MTELFALLALIGLVGLLALTRKKPREPAPFDPTKPYSVFCHDFDLEVQARDIGNTLGLPDISSEQLLEEVESGLAAWRARHDFAALDMAERIRSKASKEVLQDTVVSLLIDHSGSMRGQRMLLAVGTAMIACDLLDNIGAKHEVLGFTTVHWRGGLSRKKWLRSGRPPYPGRLNDLLHVVYCSAGQRLNPHECANMLRPGLHKENLDGEAIQWAASRLRERPESKKCIIVVSDGAPVDDSTLMENGGPYLEHHLREVIRELAQSGDVQLFAIGIGYDVDRYYEQSVAVRMPEDLGKALLGLIERLFSAPRATD